jgi:hypothetical protein
VARSPAPSLAAGSRDAAGRANTATAQGGQGSGHPPPALPADGAPGSSIRRWSGGSTAAAWELHRDGILYGRSLSGGDIPLSRCSLLQQVAPPLSVEMEPLQLLPTPCNRQTRLLRPCNSLEGNGEKGGRSRQGSGGSYVCRLPPTPTAPESAFCGSSLSGAVLRSRLVVLRQKTAPPPKLELYQRDPKSSDFLLFLH